MTISVVGPEGSDVAVTDVAAWWGALVATGVLMWDIYKWLCRVQLLVTVKPNMRILYEEPPVDHVVIEVSNIGERAVTLTHILGEYYETRLQRLRRKPTTGFFATPAAFGGTLPHLLEPGERWIASVPQSGLDEYSSGFVRIGIAHASSKRPILKWLSIPKGEPPDSPDS